MRDTNADTSRPSPYESRKGQIIVLYGAVLVVLLAICVLTIDVGHMVTSQAELQNAADAAALAALLEMWEQRASTQSEDDARLAGARDGAAIAQVNHPGAGIETTWGIWEDDHFVATDTSTPAHAVRVRAYRNDDAPGKAQPTFFAAIFGMKTVDQATSATARYNHKGLAPFAIHEPAVLGRAPGEEVIFYDDSQDVPGNFGLLDFMGGGGGLDELAYWVEHGYDGPFTIDPVTGHIPVDGSTGFKAALASYIQDHVNEGDSLVACIYRNVAGVGDNAVYEIVGFVEIVITYQRLTGTNPHIRAEIRSWYISGVGDTQGSLHDIMELNLLE